MANVGIFYHSDPAGSVPSGIDSFIRGILRWAPTDLQYTLYGASSDPVSRPIGREAALQIGPLSVNYLPLISIDPSAGRSFVPFSIQYMWALRRIISTQQIRRLHVLDFHRVEPCSLFKDDRPKNVILHQDMSVIRDKNSDIKWRYAPWLYERIEHRLFRRVDRIFAVRESAVTRYTKLYPDLANKFAFLPTWVDTETFRPADQRERSELRQRARQKLGVGADAKVLVFVGRLDRQKDPMLLLEAFQSALSARPDLHLAYIGDGALRTRLESAVRLAQLSKSVTLTGALDRASIAGILQSADLFVMSSAYEGMPIAVLEALATGLPVVSTDVGELKRVISNGVNGYLSAQRTAQSLAEVILAGLSRLEQMKGEASEASVRPYHPEKILARIYDNHRRQAATRAA